MLDLNRLLAASTIPPSRRAGKLGTGACNVDMSYQVRWGSWLQLLSEESRGKTIVVDSWEMGSECWKLGLLGSHMDEAKCSAWLARLESRVKFQGTRYVCVCVCGINWISINVLSIFALEHVCWYASAC